MIFSEFFSWFKKKIFHLIWLQECVKTNYKVKQNKYFIQSGWQWLTFAFLQITLKIFYETNTLQPFLMLSSSLDSVWRWSKNIRWLYWLTVNIHDKCYISANYKYVSFVLNTSCWLMINYRNVYIIGEYYFLAAVTKPENFTSTAGKSDHWNMLHNIIHCSPNFPIQINIHMQSDLLVPCPFKNLQFNCYHNNCIAFADYMVRYLENCSFTGGQWIFIKSESALYSNSIIELVKLIHSMQHPYYIFYIPSLQLNHLNLVAGRFDQRSYSPTILFSMKIWNVLNNPHQPVSNSFLYIVVMA